MVKLHFLGTAQDSGIPQVGCQCVICIKARTDPKYHRLVACLAIVGEETILMIDATPDYREQVTILNKSYPKVRPHRYEMGADSILITHLHVGHYLGLLNLGKEIASTKNYPVFMTEEVQSYLRANKPFSYLEERGEAKFDLIRPGQSYKIDPGFSFEVFEVPHRNEDANTIGIRIISTRSNRSVIYIPDLDYFTPNVIDRLQSADIAILDGSFYSTSDFPWQSQVPHPPMTETVKLIGERKTGSFYFTHFNHTNPILKQGDEERLILKMGYNIANDNQIIEL